MRFHHVGLACENIEKELESLRQIFEDIEFSEKVYDPMQNVELCMVNMNGIRVELISGQPVENILKRKIKLYHICYEVDDFDLKVKKLQEEGALLISGVKDTTLFANKRVAFFLLNNGMIIELLGDKNG